MGATPNLSKTSTRASAALAERLQRSFPGGDTRESTFFTPFPLALAGGSGFTVRDVDGNAYIDLLNNFTALIHGHSPTQITEALSHQLKSALSLSGPTPMQAELAERIVGRIPSIESLRFTNSGTEANMLAVRAARAVTGRSGVVKADGGYHGSWEQLPMSSGQRGIPDSVAALVQMVTYNDVDELEAVMAASGAEIAAIILEPVLGGGGVIAGHPDYLAAARRLATAHGAVLIFDEVMTARLAVGGRQEALGITPDLTTLGKFFGGGLPIGIVGGQREILDVFNPLQPAFVSHGGTFNGNPMTMVAGCVSLDQLTAGAISELNRLGHRLSDGLEELVTPLGGQVTSCGSMIQIHLEPHGKVGSWRDVNLSSPQLATLHSACLGRGIYFARRGMMNISTPMEDSTISDVLERIAAAIDDMSSSGASGRSV